MFGSCFCYYAFFYYLMWCLFFVWVLFFCVIVWCSRCVRHKCQTNRRTASVGTYIWVKWNCSKCPSSYMFKKKLRLENGIPRINKTIKRKLHVKTKLNAIEFHINCTRYSRVLWYMHNLFKNSLSWTIDSMNFIYFRFR